MSSEFFLIRTSVLSTRYSALSFDNPVRPRQHIWWNRQADLLGGFQIDHQLELRRLLHGEIRGLGAFEDLVHIRGGAPIQIGNARRITHKPANVQKFWRVIYRWEPALYCKVRGLFSVRIKDRALQHEDAISMPLVRFSKRSLNILRIQYV